MTFKKGDLVSWTGRKGSRILDFCGLVLGAKDPERYYLVHFMWMEDDGVRTCTDEFSVSVLARYSDRRT